MAALSLVFAGIMTIFLSWLGGDHYISGVGLIYSERTSLVILYFKSLLRMLDGIKMLVLKGLG